MKPSREDKSHACFLADFPVLILFLQIIFPFILRQSDTKMCPRIEGDMSPGRIDGDGPLVQGDMSPGTGRCVPMLEEMCPQVQEDVSPGTGRCVPGYREMVPGYRALD